MKSINFTVFGDQSCLVSMGMQVKAGKFVSVSPMKIKLDKPIVVLPNDLCVLLKPESKSIRIIGSGKTN